MSILDFDLTFSHVRLIRINPPTNLPYPVERYISSFIDSKRVYSTTRPGNGPERGSRVYLWLQPGSCMV